MHNVICLWFARQLEDFSTYVKSSKIRVWKANTKVQSLINLLTSRIPLISQASLALKFLSFVASTLFFKKKQNLDRFALLIG